MPWLPSAARGVSMSHGPSSKLSHTPERRFDARRKSTRRRARACAQAPAAEHLWRARSSGHGGRSVHDRDWTVRGRSECDSDSCRVRLPAIVCALSLQARVTAHASDAQRWTKTDGARRLGDGAPARCECLAPPPFVVQARPSDSACHAWAGECTSRRSLCPHVHAACRAQRHGVGRGTSGGRRCSELQRAAAPRGSALGESGTEAAAAPCDALRACAADA
jgi:hypothetical protein